MDKYLAFPPAGSLQHASLPAMRSTQIIVESQLEEPAIDYDCQIDTKWIRAAIQKIPVSMGTSTSLQHKPRN
jgi:hypothetical protein